MASRHHPLVSIIMANFNGQDHLARAVSSVLAQSITDIELLLVDDASTDASLSIAEQIVRHDDRVRILRTSRNSGPAVARNRALNDAAGEWIAIVDADDIVHPERFERLIAGAEAAGTDGVADDLIYFGETPHPHGQVLTGTLPLDAPVDLTPNALVEMPTLGYLKPVLRRSVVGDLRYREDIRIGEDHDFYLRYLLGGGRLHLMRQSYYLYRRHRNSISHRHQPEDLAAILSAQDDLVAQYPDITLDLAAKFDRRRKDLNRSMRFEHLVQDIKRRKWGKALRKICIKPTLLVPLFRAVREHWQNRTTQWWALQETVVRDVVLRADGQDDCALPQGAALLKIPKHPDQWSSADWAKLIASLPARVDRVFVQGAPGCFALGYVPQCNAIIHETEDGQWTENWEPERTGSQSCVPTNLAHPGISVAGPGGIKAPRRYPALDRKTG